MQLCRIADSSSVSSTREARPRLCNSQGLAASSRPRQPEGCLAPIGRKAEVGWGYFRVVIEERGSPCCPFAFESDSIKPISAHKERHACSVACHRCLVPVGVLARRWNAHGVAHSPIPQPSMVRTAISNRVEREQPGQDYFFWLSEGIPHKPPERHFDTTVEG